MYNFKVLVEGYAYAGKDGEYYASPSSILVWDDSVKVLVDPGTNKEKLLEGLKGEGLGIDDIDMIFLSHYHPDHFLNIRLFPNTPIYDGGVKWEGDREDFHKDTLPNTSIEIVATPGHASEMASLIINTKEYGVVALSQDVFWWEDGSQKSDTVQDLMDLVDPFASSVEDLKKSREIILSKADWIVPGHGKVFKNPKRV